MTLKFLFSVIVLGLLGLCASCGPESNATKQESVAESLPVIRITDDIKPLSFDEVELTLEIVSRDPRGLPKEIGLTFRNKSSARGCLALPRPVIEGQRYEQSLPCLAVGMRETGFRTGSTLGEPFFLDTRPRPDQVGPLEGVYLDPGESITLQYTLSNCCVIGHGIGPKAEANFLTCYDAGNEESELRAYVITDWSGFQRSASNSILVKSSKFDFSVRLKFAD